MKTKSVISYVFIALIISVLLFPSNVFADDGKGSHKINLMAGDKVTFSNDIEATFTGKYDAKNGKPIWKSAISAPIYKDYYKGERINCRWIYDGTKFYTGANLFYAEYKNGSVDINYGETKWNPQITLIQNGKNISTKIISQPLIIDDYFNSNYRNNILRISYVSDSGVYFTRDLRIIEGVLSELYTFSAYPNGSISINENIKGSNAHLQNASAWDKNGKSINVALNNGIKFISDDDLKNAIYPVTIDPSSTYYTSASDGHIQAYNSVYGTVHNAATGSVYASNSYIDIGQWYYSGSGYVIQRGYVYFDTSSLPDDVTVSGAILSFYGISDASATSFNITIQNGMSTYPHDPLVAGDYYYANYSGNGGYLSTGSYVKNSYNNITLNSTGIGWVNLTGTTKFEIVSSRDISSTPPAAVDGTSEYVGMYAYEKGVGYRPTFYVTYSADPPVVSTSDASSITCSSSTWNGNIDNLSGDTVTFRGFVYGTTSNSTAPSEGQKPPAGYATNTSEYSSSGFSTGSFSASSTVSSGTTYYFRAYAYNSSGWGYGDEYSVTTLGSPSITRNAATSVTSTTARLQSTLNSGGGSTCQVMWGWGTTDKGNNIEQYDNWITWSGSYSTGDSPFYDISSLSPSTTYYFNVKASNTCGNTTATSGSFATGNGVAAPTNVIAQPNGNNSVSLSWVKSSTTPLTRIRYGENFIPTSNTTGTLLYGGSGSNYLHQGLNAGSTYYYFFQGYDTTLGYSADNVTVVATVSTDASTSGTPAAISTPSNWLEPSDTSTFMTYNPVAPLINNCIDALGVPRATGWFFIAVIISIFVSGMLYAMTRDTMVLIFSILIVMTFCSFIGFVAGIIGWITAILCIAIAIIKIRGVM